VKQCGSQFRAGAAEGVTQGDGAAVDVHPRGREFQFPDDGKGLGSERLIQFDQVDLVKGQAGELERLRNRLDRSDSHEIRRHACDGERPEDCKRRKPQPFRFLPRHHQYGGRAVAGLGRVACRDGAALVEHRRKLGERLGGGVVPDPLVGVEDHLIGSDARCTIATEYLPHDGERDDLVLESFLLDSGSGLDVALEREVVLLLSAHLVRPNKVFSAVPHRDVDSRIVFREVGVGRVGISAHRNQTHTFCPARDDHVGKAGHDPFGSYGDGLQSRGAKAVDRLSRNGVRQPCPQGRHPRHIHTLFRLREGAADDDILDLSRLKSRRPLHEFGNHGSRHRSRGCSAERTAWCFAHRRSHRRHNHRFFHLTHSRSKQGLGYSV